MNEIIKNENVAIAATPKPQTAMSVGQLKEQVQVIQQVLTSVMIKGTHYDALPGTGKWEQNPRTGKKEYIEGKPILLKPGAEKINMVFHIGSEPHIERETEGIDTHFHITCRMFDIATGNTLGYGVGEGSTNESKWAWRRAVCHEEYEATLETQRRIHWQKKYKSSYNSKEEFEAIEQVRQNPADIINTVLKMAVKRAEVDGCRKVTACSDVFEQDIDEKHIREAVMPEQSPVEEIAQQRFTQPRQKAPAAVEQPDLTAGTNLISEAQRKRLYAIGKGQGLSDEELSFIVFQYAGVERSAEIPRDKYDLVVEITEKAQPGNVIR